MDYFNQDGHLNDEGFALYSDAVKLEKTSELPESFRIHLESCPACQHEVIDFSAIMADVEQGEAHSHPFFNQDQTLNKQRTLKSLGNEQFSSSDKEETEMRKPQMRKLFYRLAIAAVLGTLVFFGYKQFFPSEHSFGIVNNQPEVVPAEELPIQSENDKTQENVIVEKENDVKQPLPAPEHSTKEKSEIEIQENISDQQLFAANYVPNEELESMIGTTFRSDNFKIKKPGNHAVFKKDAIIVFEWENNISLNLSILNNEEEEQIVESVSGVQFELSSKLDPGIYYWKLETEDDLLHLGKFIIE